MTEKLLTGTLSLNTTNQRSAASCFQFIVFTGIYYAMKGEGAKAAGAGAGLWGSLSGGVIGKT